MVNLQEQLDDLDIFRRFTGIRLQDCYNLLLKKGWTLGSGELLKGLHVIIRMFQPALVRLLRDFWRAGQPDMVVSLIPNFNRALKLSLEAALPGTPLVTILTDIADYPPHFWIERQQQYLVCGSDRAAVQARELGYADRFVFRASGMILNPRFYAPIEADRSAERQRLGLNPEWPTGLVLFGGEGSAAMLEIACRLEAAARPLQLILICGRNQKLADRLRAMGYATAVQPFSTKRDNLYLLPIQLFVCAIAAVALALATSVWWPAAVLLLAYGTQPRGRRQAPSFL